MPRRDETPPTSSGPEDLQDLDRRIREKIAVRRPPTSDGEDHPNKSWGIALRLGGDLAGGLIVGGFLGWGIDHLAGSAPWGMLIGFMLGFAAGMRNLMRTAQNYNAGKPPGGGNG